jgi:hypothetical protein
MSDCIAAVTQPEMTDTEVDDDTISLESEYVVDWTDHLTAVVEARLRKYVPRDVVHTAPADPEYCETLTEATVVINGHTVDQVGLALLAYTPGADWERLLLRTIRVFYKSYAHIEGETLDEDEKARFHHFVA